MSCYDWSRQLAHRFDPGIEPEPEWKEARDHLEECPECRGEALGLDPTLGFRGSARWSPDAADTEEIRSAVRTLRRAERLSAGSEESETDARGRGRLASAVLFALLLAMMPGGASRRSADSGVAQLRSEPPMTSLVGPTAPAIEGLDRPQARVYEWGGDDLSVVMVVDESLDV